MTITHNLLRRSAYFAVLLTCAGMLIGPRDAMALTMMLDFGSITKTDGFGETTGAFDALPFGFAAFNQTQAEQAILAAVDDHYHGYPSAVLDPLSPLPFGQELDIDFEIGLFGSGPISGDSEYYYMLIGTGLSGTAASNAGILGQACLDCVRNGAGVANVYGIPLGTGVGSIFTDHIDNLAFLAGNDAQLINLIAGTISHEIGHALSLIHTGALAPNPGASAWGVMGSGATSMPNGDRVLEREFTYANMANLITSVGLRDIATLVPAPAIAWLWSGGLAMLWLVIRARRSGPVRVVVLPA